MKLKMRLNYLSVPPSRADLPATKRRKRATRSTAPAGKKVVFPSPTRAGPGHHLAQPGFPRLSNNGLPEAYLGKVKGRLQATQG